MPKTPAAATASLPLPPTPPRQHSAIESYFEATKPLSASGAADAAPPSLHIQQLYDAATRPLEPPRNPMSPDAFAAAPGPKVRQTPATQPAPSGTMTPEEFAAAPGPGTGGPTPSQHGAVVSGLRNLAAGALEDVAAYLPGVPGIHRFEQAHPDEMPQGVLRDVSPEHLHHAVNREIGNLSSPGGIAAAELAKPMPKMPAAARAFITKLAKLAFVSAGMAQAGERPAFASGGLVGGNMLKGLTGGMMNG